MPLQRTIHYTGAGIGRSDLTLPGTPRQVFFETDQHKELIVTQCHPNDTYGELHVIKDVESEDIDMQDIGQFLNEETLVKKIVEKDFPYEYRMMRKSDIVGIVVVSHFINNPNWTVEIEQSGLHWRI